MQELPDFTIEHFADRSAKWLFQYTHNVEGLLEIVAAELVGSMEVEAMAQSMAEVLFEEGKVQGIEQGIEQEKRESAIRHILVVLETKFAADIVNVLTPAIENISDVERLEQLLPAAVEAQSLEAFARILHEDGS